MRDGHVDGQPMPCDALEDGRVEGLRQMRAVCIDQPVRADGAQRRREPAAAELVGLAPLPFGVREIDECLERRNSSTE